MGIETKHYSADGKLKWVVPPQDNAIKKKFPDAKLIGYEKQDISKWIEKGFVLQTDEYGNYYAVPAESMERFMRERDATKAADRRCEEVNSHAWHGD